LLSAVDIALGKGSAKNDIVFWVN